MTLPKISEPLTSYDIIKVMAVIFMLTGHVGFYFFPDEAWFRVFGRFCVIIWFFLIGYARSRDLSPRLWGGALLLVVLNFVSGVGLMPFNVLATIIVIRLTIDSLAHHLITAHRPWFWWGMAGLVALLLPTMFIFDYGTTALLVALYGWIVRHRLEIEGGKSLAERYFLFVTAIFVASQCVLFGFDVPQTIVLGAGVAGLLLALGMFKPVKFAGSLTGRWRWASLPLRVIGRRTLEIYVLHVVIFQIAVMAYQPERFQWFDWQLFPKMMYEIQPTP